MKKMFRTFFAVSLAAAFPISAFAMSDSGANAVSGFGTEAVSGSGTEAASDFGAEAMSGSGTEAVSGFGTDAMSDSGSDILSDSSSGSASADAAGETEFDWADYGSSGSLSREEARQLQALIARGGTGVAFEEATDVQLTFDTAANRYQYALPNKYQMQVTVPNGAVTTGPVILNADKDTTDITVTRDHEAYDLEAYDSGNSYYFSEPGCYELEMLCSPGDYSGDDLVIYQYRFSFQILKDGLSRQNFLVAPDGYTIGHITRNGQPVKVTNPVCMSLRDDGTYQIRFSAEGLPDYRVSFTKDTIAPTLTFSKSIVGKSLKLPLSFEKAQKDSQVTVYHDGNEVTLSGQDLNQGGWYLISVSDKAGNTRSYHFFVKQTYRLFNRHLVTLLAVVVIGVLLTGTGSIKLHRKSW